MQPSRAAELSKVTVAVLPHVKPSEVMESSEVTAVELLRAERGEAADKGERWSVDGGGDVCRKCRGCQGASNDGAGGASDGGVPKSRLVARAI